MATSINVDTYVLRGGKYIIDKDPNAVLDYSFDWTDWLAAASDAIVDAQFVLDPALTLVNQGFNATSATVWVGGGAVSATGAPLRVTCRITTAEGRTDDRSIYLKIRER